MIHAPITSAGVCTCRATTLRIHEDPGPDDAAHHDHRRVERAKATCKRRFRRTRGVGRHESANTRDVDSPITIIRRH